MCLAVPAKIAEINQGVATCRVGEGDTFIKASLLLLDEEPQIGDYLIVHAGFALRRMDLQEAEESLKILREMISLVEGQASGNPE